MTLFGVPAETRPSSRKDRVRVPDFFQVAYFSRGTLPPKKGQRALLGDLVKLICPNDLELKGEPCRAMTKDGPKLGNLVELGFRQASKDLPLLQLPAFFFKQRPHVNTASCFHQGLAPPKIDDDV